MTEPRRTPYPLSTILPPVTVGDSTPTIPAPAAGPTDSEKLDTALGLLELISNRVLELDGKVDRLGAETDAVKQHLSGIRGATEDLRPRVERLESEELRARVESLEVFRRELEEAAAEHVNGSGGE